MPEVEIVKLKIRRGTDSQRSTTILEQGELGYTNDYSRVWVGDGVTEGGSVIGNVTYDSNQVRTTITAATKGDIVYDEGKLYRLTSTTPSTQSDWEFIGTKVDPTFIEYNAQNEISIIDSCITTTQIDSSIVLGTGAINFSAGGLSVNIDDVTIENTNNALNVKNDSIGADQINSSVLTNGLTGGSGNPIGLNINTDYLTVGANRLELTGVPDGVITSASLSSNFVGRGLTIDAPTQTLEAVVQAVDFNNYDLLDVAGINTLTPKERFAGSGNIESFDSASYDKYGIITGVSQVSIGLGLTALGNTIAATFQDINDNNLVLSGITTGLPGAEITTNTLDLKEVFPASDSVGPLDTLTYDKYGRVESHTSNLGEPLEANDATTLDGNTLPYLDGIYNGALDQSTYTDQTVIDTLLTVGGSTQTVSLTSAGFIQVDLGGSNGVVAIPVFRPPSP